MFFFFIHQFQFDLYCAKFEYFWIRKGILMLNKVQILHKFWMRFLEMLCNHFHFPPLFFQNGITCNKFCTLISRMTFCTQYVEPSYLTFYIFSYTGLLMIDQILIWYIQLKSSLVNIQTGNNLEIGENFKLFNCKYL